MVTVISTAGGQDTAAVATSQGGTFVPGAPVAVDDTVEVPAGAQTMTIPVLANDRNADTTAVTATQALVHLVTQPRQGTAVVQADQSVRYTPTNPAVVGEDTFTYTLVPGTIRHPSNVATVTVITTQPVGGPAPIATNDGPFVVRVQTSLVLTVASLLTNDQANGATIDPASFALVAGAATGGTATLGNGQVTYTAGAVAGSGSFQYTIASTTGVTSAPATVSLTILPATDTLTIANARFRTGNRRWDVDGTATVTAPGNVVTVALMRGTRLIGTLGTATVDAAGTWSLRALNSNIIAQNGDIVRATSTAGGTATLAVRVTN